MSQASLLPPASGGAARERVITDHARHVTDWYVDPSFCTELLLDAVPFFGPIWDPCCGGGTIPTVVAKRFLSVAVGGSDLVYRGYGQGDRDFFVDPGPHENLIFNPPYKDAERFIRHAIGVTRRKVAALVNLKFLASQGRRERLFNAYPPAEVLILSRRPSMPPGDSGIEAKGGTADYCWIVFSNEQPKPDGHPVIRWIA